MKDNMLVLLDAMLFTMSVFKIALQMDYLLRDNVGSSEETRTPKNKLAKKGRQLFMWLYVHRATMSSVVTPRFCSS